MTRRTAKRSEQSRLHAVCPFCGFLCTRDTVYSWCSGCFVEYYKNRNGDIVFNTKRKTDRFIWAKAFQKAGGMRMGNPPSDTDTKSS